MNRYLISALAIFLLIALVLIPAYAKQSITLTLDEPQFKSSPTTEAPTTSTPTEKPRAEARAETPSTNNGGSTIGRVGVVSAPKVSIYRSRTSSKVLATCAQGTPLGLVGEQGNWYGVLMIDMSVGWVRKTSVRLLDYDLIATKKLGAPGNGSGSQIVQSAMKYLGVPYVWGGSSWNGLDCSGFVQTVYSQNGVSLPRVSRDQANVGYPVGWDDLQPGDRLYFACKSSTVDHAGIYMGSGYFIHSSSSRGGVAVDSLTSGFFARTLVTARRS